MKAAMLHTNKPVAPGCKLPPNPNEADIRFVMTELDRALSLLYLVGTSFAAEQRKRSWRDARIAYDAALALLPDLVLDDSQEAAIDARLHQIRLRFERLGPLLTFEGLDLPR